MFTKLVGTRVIARKSRFSKFHVFSHHKYFHSYKKINNEEVIKKKLDKVKRRRNNVFGIFVFVRWDYLEKSQIFGYARFCGSLDSQ